MNHVVRNIYITIIGLLIVSFLVLNAQYHKAESIIREEVSQSVRSAGALAQQEIDAWVVTHEVVLEGLGNSVSLSGYSDEARISRLFKETVRVYPEFTSVYFGTPDHTLIISNDWVPEADFDLTIRPWYVDAAAANGTVVTDPFTDAYTGAQIISISLPVKDIQGRFIGVLAGDVQVDTIASYVRSLSRSIMSDTFLVSTEGNILAESVSGTYSGDLLEALLSDAELQGRREGEITQVLGVSGFTINHPIYKTKWRILGFTPLSAHDGDAKELRLAMYALLGLMIICFCIIAEFQRRNVAKPLVDLERQIAAIDLSNAGEFKITLASNAVFKNVQNRINDLLSLIFEHIQEIRSDKEELHALNEELEASFGQLVAVEQEVTMQKENFEALFRNSPNAIAMFDQNHRVIDINQGFAKLFGYTLAEIFGKNLDDVVMNHRMETNAITRTEAVFRGEIVDFEATRYNRHDQAIPMHITGVSILSGGHVIGGYGIYTDISASIEHSKELEYVGNHDYLTDVFNRRYFELYMNDIEQEAMLPMSLVTVDINGLKLINDAFGNEKGDEMLRMTAMFLAERAQTISAPVFRTGGDEFAIILTQSDAVQTERFCKRLRKESAQLAIGDLPLSLAIGWAERTTLEKDGQKLFKEAEDFMFSHKLSENPSIRGKTINTIMSTLHEKSRREEQHSKRVSELSYTLGKALGLKQRELDELRMMGLLHDVGKIAIEDKILNKPARLSDEEYQIMKRHPEIGYRILSSVNELSEIANHVLAHHERWDGKGYPKGLSGDEIPYLARIIAVIDAYDAMTSNRSYRQGISIEAAVIELSEHAGTQFDPDIVKVFIQYLSEMENL